MCIRDRYKEEGKAEFNAALQNAKAVLEKADADQDEIDQATLASVSYTHLELCRFRLPKTHTLKQMS